MKIVVLMKQVPNKDAILRVRGDGKWVEEGDLSFEVNESDGYALEDPLDEGIGSNALGIGPVGEDQTMAQHIESE